MSNVISDAFDDPFSDPSIKQAAGDSSLQRLEDYNPFSPNDRDSSNTQKNKNTNNASYDKNTKSHPAVLVSTQEQIPSKSTGALTAELQKKQEELERKAQELEQREQELQNAAYNVHAIGIPGVETCGFVVTIRVFSHGGSGYILGALALLVSLAFATASIMDLVMLLKVHALYRSTGASFQKAQAEFTQGVLHSEHMQNAAANAASAAMKNQFSNMAAKTSGTGRF